VQSREPVCDGKKYIYICIYIYTYILNRIQYFSTLRKYHLKVWLTETGLVPKTSETLQTALASEARRTGRFLFEKQTLNVEYSLIFRAGTRRRTVSKRGQNVEPRWTSIRKAYQGGTSSYARCAVLSTLKHNYNCDGNGATIIPFRQFFAYLHAYPAAQRPIIK
jgi:hypothetical protein